MAVGARDVIAAGVGEAREIEHRLDAAVLPGAAVEREKHHIDIAHIAALGREHRAPRRIPASAEPEGGCGPTPLVSSRCSAGPESLPVAVSTAITSCPSPRSAGITCAALAIDTSRSSLVPPKRTAIFMS